MKLRLTLAAENDLEHIRDTIVPANPVASERVQQQIARAMELLRSFPNLGRPGSVEGTRERKRLSPSPISLFTLSKVANLSSCASIAVLRAGPKTKRRRPQEDVQ